VASGAAVAADCDRRRQGRATRLRDGGDSLVEKVYEMSPPGNTTAVSALQEFAEEKSRLAGNPEFSQSEMIDYVMSRRSCDRKTIINGLKSMTTNSRSRQDDYRIVKGKEWRDGKNRDLFFRLDDGGYRLYDPSRDPEPFYYTGTEEDAEAAEERAVEEASDDPAPEFIPGLGEVTYFDPFDDHERDNLPREAGIYAFRHISKRYSYIGKTSNLRSRVKHHYRQARWCVPNDVIKNKCWFVRVPDEDLRNTIEAMLIMVAEPIYNYHHIDRDDEED
jgi:hypothetical protein